MKLKLFLVLIVCGPVTAAVHSQNNILDVQWKNVALEQVIWELEQKTDYTFMYWTAEIQDVKVTLDIKQKSINDILDLCLRNTGLKYKINDNSVVIHRVQQQQAEREAERIVVKGSVKDTKGEPLPGVTIRLEGTSLGVTTNQDGRFEFSAPNRKGMVLVASFIGMKEVRMHVVPDKELNFKMEEAVNEMDEVVVNGYFTQNRNSYTGAVTTIKGDQLLEVSKTDVLKALSFSVPGLRIVTDNASGSNPNKVPEIILRGMNSLDSENMEQGLNRPLIIMDGVEISLQQLYDLDMFDIDRVDVLKDASATAMYGEKAANGVIVVVRKRVMESKLRVRYNFVPNIGFPDVSSFNLCSPWEKLELERLYGKYDSNTGAFDELYNEKLKRINAGVNTDWKSIPLRNSWSHAHSLSITGRGSGMDYGINASYSDDRGVMKKDYRRNLGLGFYFSYHLNNKLTMSFRSDFYKTNSKDSPYGNYSDWVVLNPYDSPVDENGEWVKVLSYEKLNPIYNATLSSFSVAESKRFTNSLSLRWDIVKGLYFTGNANYSMANNQSDVYVSPDDSRFMRTETKEDEKGSYDLNGGNDYSWALSGVLNYSLSLDENGTILSLHGGADVSQSGGSTFAFRGVGFTKDRLDDLNFAQRYPNEGKPSGSESYSATVAYFANANFILKDRYFVDFSWRTSGNSVISKDRRWSPYWSAGIGWNIHNEVFLANLEWVESFRFRASAGYVGSNNFGGTFAQTIYEYGEPYDDYQGALPSSMGNDKLKSQRTLKLNGGVSLDLFEGRLGVNVDFYKETSKDLLMDISLPSSTGYDKVKYNLGESSNRGYEIAVSGSVIRTRDWGWTLTATTSHTANKILKISNSLKNVNDANRDDNTSSPKIQLEEGESATSIYAVRSAGIDPASGREIYIKKDGTYTFTFDPKDKVALGNTTPIMQGSLSTGVRWKALTVFVGMSYTFGGDIYNSTRAGKIENISIEENVDRRAFTERWKNVNDYVMYPSVQWPSAGHTERFVERNNELYLSAINISYNLEGDWLKKIGLRRLGLGIGFSDIARLSTVKYERGTSYPYMRGYSFTISPTF